MTLRGKMIVLVRGAIVVTLKAFLSDVIISNRTLVPIQTAHLNAKIRTVQNREC